MSKLIFLLISICVLLVIFNSIEPNIFVRVALGISAVALMIDVILKIRGNSNGAREKKKNKDILGS